MQYEEIIDVDEDGLRKIVNSQVNRVLKTRNGLADRVADLEKRQQRLAGSPNLGDGSKSFPNVNRGAARDSRGLLEDEFSFHRAISAIVNRDFSSAPLEAEAFSAGKAMSIGTDSAGGYLAPETWLPEKFVSLYTANQVCRQAGVTVLSCTGQTVKIPAEATGMTVAWMGENAAISEATPTLTEITMQPRQCAAIIKMSRLLIENDAGATEAYLRKALAEKLGLAVDLAVLRGTGTNSQPTGMANTSAINTYAIGTNGGSPTLAHLKAMVYELDVDNVPDTRRAWLMHSRTWQRYDEALINSETNNYVLQHQVALGTPRQLLGYPVFISNQIPITLSKGTGTALSEIYLVEMPDVIIGDWSGISLEASVDAGFDYHQLWIKAVVTVDVCLPRPTAVCLCSDAA